MTIQGCKVLIVGLGPGNPGLRTVQTQRMLDAADCIILRTRIHPGTADLLDDPRVTSCDDLYEGAKAFDQLYEQIAARVILKARESGAVVFAVPGHPRVGERSVPIIEAAAAAVGIECAVFDAVSFVDSVSNETRVDPLSVGLQIVDAEQIAAAVDAEPFGSGLLGIDPVRAVLVAQVYSSRLASFVKLGLGRVFPDDHPIVVVNASSVRGDAKTTALPLCELDHGTVDHLTTVLVPPLSPLEALRSSDTLFRIVARLRAPGGCPWDREQTHRSLRDAILEEAYETVDAVNADDPASLAEELGDLLLLVAMHAQIADEEGSFRIEDIFEGISRKLIRRHPHVFGDVIAPTPDSVIATWEGVKTAERKASGLPPKSDHPLEKLPRSMPAIQKAARVFAPNLTLTEPADPSVGGPLLSAVKELLETGIDPERALHHALWDATAPSRHHATEGAEQGFEARSRGVTES